MRAVIATLVASVVAGAWCTAAVLAGRAPVGVSPGGSSSFVEIESRCPTFSWSGVEGASAYRVVVYDAGSASGGRRVPGSGAQAPILDVYVPAAAQSWTPSTAVCLRQGGEYVWFVAPASGPSAGSWSDGRLFSVSPGLDKDRIDRALAALRQDSVPAIDPARSPAPVAKRSRAGQQPGEPLGNRLSSAAKVAEESGGVGGEQNIALPPPAEVWNIRSESDHDTLRSFAVWGMALNNETGSTGVLGQAASETGLVDGVRGETSSYDGAGVSGLSYRTDGDATGVKGRTLASLGYGGLFRHGTSGGAALYARAADDTSADLVLGSTSASSNDGILRSHPGDSSSDLLIESNDFLVLRLDRSGTSSSFFAIRNGANGNILYINEGGAASLNGSLTVSSSLTVNGSVQGNLPTTADVEAIADAIVDDHETGHPLP